MKQIKIDIREIVFSNEEGKSFCDIFVYEPENIEEQSLGSLYILGEVVNLSSNSSYLINLLASIAKKEFYSNTKRSVLESLEASLHEVNSALSDTANQGNIDWIGNLNMIFCVYKNEELHLSQTGKVRTILIRDKQATDIGKTTIVEDSSRHIRTFTNIASGELEVGDLVLFATPGLFNIFSTEKLNQLASSLNIENFAEEIQEKVEKEGDINTMGLFIMKVEDEKEKEFSHIEIKSKEEEIIPTLQENINENEQEVVSIKNEGKEEEEKKEKITSNPKTSTSEKKISLEDVIKEYEVEKKESDEKIMFPKERKVNEKNKFLENNSQQREKEIDPFLQALDKDNNINLLDNISNRLKNIISKENIFYIINKIKNSILVLMKKIKRTELNSESIQLSNLSLKSKKIPLFALVLIVLILTGGLLIENKKKINEKNLSEYASLIENTEETIGKAEIELINSPADAKKYLLEAREIIGQREYYEGNAYLELNDKAIDLINKIQNKLDVLDFVERIENPQIAIDLSQFDEIKNANKIFENNGEYFILNKDNEIFSKINFTEKNADIIDIKNIRDNGLSSYMKKTNEIIFLNNKQNATILNPDKKTIIEENINLPSNTSITKAIASYSNYLYLLVPESNQIYKYKKLKNGFDDGKKWLEEEIDIKNSISMTIDGSIYLLNSDGSIQKLRTGEKETFAIEFPSDPISSDAKIYTNSNLKYLYVTDIKNQRIILFNKTNGKLIKQYTSKKFNDIKNIVISNNEEKIYILNGNEIFEVAIKL